MLGYKNNAPEFCLAESFGGDSNLKKCNYNVKVALSVLGTGTKTFLSHLIVKLVSVLNARACDIWGVEDLALLKVLFDATESNQSAVWQFALWIPANTAEVN